MEIKERNHGVPAMAHYVWPSAFFTYGGVSCVFLPVPIPMPFLPVPSTSALYGTQKRSREKISRTAGRKKTCFFANRRDFFPVDFFQGVFLGGCFSSGDFYWRGG
jgi:hypothetical protein